MPTKTNPFKGPDGQTVQVHGNVVAVVILLVCVAAGIAVSARQGNPGADS